MTSYQIHRLIENERRYVETGEISNSYRPSQMETRIQEKINLLPTRIRSLFDDIELLSEEDCLDVDSWAHGWLELLEIQQPMQQDKLKTSFTRFSDEEGYQMATAPDEFGYDLGIMASRLMLYPDMVEYGDVLADMVWGFLQGAYWGQDESPAHAIKILEDRILNNYDRHEQTMQGFEFMSDQVGEIEDRIDTRIESVLKGEGIDATAGVVKEVKNGMGGHDLTKEVSDRSTPMEEVIPSSRVLEIVERERIFEKKRLRGCLDRDATRLNEKGGTPHAEDIFIAIQNSSPPETSSRALAERLGSEKWVSRVTRVARDLAGDESDGRGGSREIFSEPPLLQGGKDAWEVTAFGEALAYYLQTSEVVRGLMPLHNISDEVVDAALDELESLPSETADKLPEKDTGVVTGFSVGE